MWKGNIGHILSRVAQDNQIDSSWLSLSPAAGMDIWRSMTTLYACQLAEKGETHQAVLFFLAVQCVREAISVYRNAEMYREAIVLAKLKLPPKDPLILELFMEWGQILEKSNNSDKAAKCYLAANQISDAIRCTAMKGDLPSLQTAAKLAHLANDPSAPQWTIRYALEIQGTRDWKTAKQELSQHQIYLLLLSVDYVLSTFLFVASPPSSETNPFDIPVSKFESLHSHFLQSKNPKRKHQFNSEIIHFRISSFENI